MFRYKLLSSLSKVFSDQAPNDAEWTGHSVLKNEKTSFQLAFAAEKDCEIEVKFASDLGGALAAYEVKEIGSCSPAYANQDDYTLRREAGLFPELLSPITGAIRAEGGKWRSVWFELSSDAPIPAGTYPVEISLVSDGEALAAVTYTLKVIDAELPKQTLVYTNWFHTDCLATHYKVDVFSKEYWEIVENFLKTAVDYGMNAVLTPIFTPPLDTKVGGERPTVQLVDVKVEQGGYRFGFDRFRQWIAMCKRAGVEYYEISHLFTQWGAKHAPKIVAEKNGKQKKIFGWSTRAAGKRYKKFLEALAPELKRVLNEEEIADRCYFHVSDEPAKNHMRSYARAAEIVRKNFGEFPVVDALSDFGFYQKGLVKLPIPANDHIGPFIGNVPELWTYYCCAQHRDYVSNRFFNMPSVRNRVLGAQMYKFDVKGFLHWGYNYYYTQFSKGEVDPFQTTDAGGAFSAGDAFVVYPGKDKKPLKSLRLPVFYDGFQDMRAMRLLESLTDRQTVLDILERDGEITFNQYPHSAEWLLKTRSLINDAIDQAISAARNKR